MDEYVKGPAERDRPDVVPGQSWPPPPQTGQQQAQVQPYGSQPPVQAPQPYGQQQDQRYGPPPQQGLAPAGAGYRDDQARTAALIMGRKSPALAGLLSLLLPGLGQFVNGAPVAGTLFLLGWLFNLPFVWLAWWLVVPVLISLGLYIWSCIHAVMGANRYNEKLLARTLGP